MGLPFSAPMMKRLQWVIVGNAPGPRKHKGVSQDDALLTWLTLVHPAPPSCTLWRTLGVTGKTTKTLISWLTTEWSHRCQSYWRNNYNGFGISVQVLLKWIFATDEIESYICLGWKRHLRPMSPTVNLWFVQEGMTRTSQGLIVMYTF